jgi:hypothetical protein
VLDTAQYLRRGGTSLEDLRQEDMKFQGVSGSNLKIQGIKRMALAMGSLEVFTEVVVADLVVPGILRLEDLTRI